MYNSARLYVGRLSDQAHERDVEKFFKGYGKLKEINLKNGFGFVEFEDPRDAEDAVYDLNGKDLCGERVIVEHARGTGRFRGGGDRDRGGDRYGYGPPRRRGGGGIDKYGPPVRTEFRVLVENLSSRVSWQDLKDYMRQAGEVTFADAHKHRANQGNVEFATQYDMENALKKLDGTELKGRKIRVVEDRPSKRRSRSRSRSRSRDSRSRSRSQSRSRSRGKSRSRSKSRSPRRSRSRSRSPSPKKSRSRSGSPRNADKDRSSDKEKSKSKSRSRSRSRDRDD
ncbi:Serine/arginine-rich splicing factor 4 [Holothuria leucospilota]|uniref:Serine/arginine-rich splicing factor 4 n=1 Tax=Holothuria leucospilota TaxID=206669 RepID=A0A9Q1CI12_HOLLE|nr:Serine/arginine-rich splicing factor 4 [Holothuria leucospilota]